MTSAPIQVERKAPGRRWRRPGALSYREPPCPNPPVIKRIQTLAQIASGLEQGDRFNITRLTILKALCANPKAAAKFALHIAKLAQKRIKPAKMVKRQGFRRLIAGGGRAMAGYLRKPKERGRAWAADAILRPSLAVSPLVAPTQLVSGQINGVLY